jgi:hypothetical protein
MRQKVTFHVQWTEGSGVRVSILQTNDKITIASLSLGMMVPIVYFGMQIVAASFYPGYNFLSQTASDLGSNQFVYASIFNVGIFVLGVVTLIAAFGFLRALLRLDTHPILAWLIGLAVAANGISSLWAAYYPLPDPRHGAQPPFLMIAILIPVLLAAALWKRHDTRALKVYLIASVLLIIAMIPFVSGMAGVDMRVYRGLVQRVFALALFPAIGIGAYFLTKYVKELAL